MGKKNKHTAAGDFLNWIISECPPELDRLFDLTDGIAIEVIQSIRRDKEMTCESLAKKLKISEDKMKGYLSGSYDFKISEIAAIETCLGREILSIIKTKKYEKE